MRISKKTLKQDIQDISHTMKDTTKVFSKIDKIYEHIENFDNFKSQKCVNCKKSTKTYNYMKKFIGYSCKDKLFKDNVDPFPKGFGCSKWATK